MSMANRFVKCPGCGRPFLVSGTGRRLGATLLATLPVALPVTLGAERLLAPAGVAAACQRRAP